MNQRQFEISLNFKLKQIDAEDVLVVRVEKCGHDSMRDMFEKNSLEFFFCSHYQ